VHADANTPLKYPDAQVPHTEAPALLKLPAGQYVPLRIEVGTAKVVCV
jgi:hypothetical protein